jgi:hypothetical protein
MHHLHNHTNTTTHCPEVTHEEYYAYSAILLLVALTYCLFRCIKWWRQRKAAHLPLLVSTALVVSLALRALWCLLRWAYWNEMHHLNDELMYLLNRLPLLLQLSAFSAISLSWIANATSNYVCFRASILSANVLLYTMSVVALVMEATESSYCRLIVEIVSLCTIAGACLSLSVLFTVFGLRLRLKLYGSIHRSSKILRSFNRIFWATCLCSISFGLRACIFLGTTISYTIFRVCFPWNYIVYPLFVYAIPSVTTSIAILFIMDVDSQDVSDDGAGGRRREGRGGGGGDYGAIADGVDEPEVR